MSKKYTKLRWRTEQKMGFIVRSWDLNEGSLGQFLRRNGLHSHDLKTWREQMKMGIDGEKPVYLEERKSYQSKIKRLQKELKEAQAIIELQKKVKQLKSEEEAVRQALKSEKKSSYSSGKAAVRV